MYKWNSLLRFHMYMSLYIVLMVLFPHCPPVCQIPFVPTESSVLCLCTLPLLQ